MALKEQTGGVGSPLSNLAVEPEETVNPLPPHLVPLTGGQWALWRTVGLRGAGFPARDVVKLAHPECAAIADHLNVARSELREARDEVLKALLDDIGKVPESESSVLEKAIKRIKKGKLPGPLAPRPARQDVLRRLWAASERVDMCSVDFNQSFEVALRNTSEAIRETVSSHRFCEAVIWQNRNAFHTGIKPVLRRAEGTPARGSKHRQHEELIANYLQRYCVKNDTIGFFGPVGWARLVSEGEPLSVEPGPGLLASRGVYFESWGIDVLAESLSRNEALRPWIAPRRMPFMHLDQMSLSAPGGVRLKLTAKEAAILHICDGWQTARELASRLLKVPALGLQGEHEVYLLLDRLVARGVIAWTLEVPVEQDAERALRRLLDRIGKDQLRLSALDALKQLESARDDVARASGDPEMLDSALRGLEARFTRLTGAASTRAAGETYAARTLVYEDCRRDAEVKIGPQLLRELEQPLALLLTSARWISYEVARMYRDASEQIYAELAAKTGSGMVEATEFWIKADPILYKEQTRIADSIVPIFQKRWADILCLKPDERRAFYTSAELWPRVRSVFDAPGPGWSYARYHSPDVMIAASGREAIKRGDYQLVMGEIHLGINTLIGALFLAQHPSPEEVHKALEADFPQPRIVPVPPKRWPALTARTSLGFVDRKNYRLEVAHDSCGVPKAQSLPIASLIIDRGDNGLVVRTRDGRVRFDIIEAFGEVLSGLVMNFFTMLTPGAHTPRVTIERLIVCRETWRFAASAMPFAYEQDESARFLSARRWMREHGLPRFVFVKAPVEKKPFYVDMDSPIYINILSKTIRRTSNSAHSNRTITLTEMIPAHDQSWLPDIDGRRYTSELRMIAVDLAG